MERTYKSWLDGDFTSEQREYTEQTVLLEKDGTLKAAGWARHNVFDYDRKSVGKEMRRKEWDFYQLSDGHYMVQLSFANISLGGYVNAVLVDLKEGKTKLMAETLKKLNATKKALVVLPERDELVVRATANLAEAKTTYVNTLNVYDILNADKLVLTKAAKESVEEVYA